MAAGPKTLRRRARERREERRERRRMERTAAAGHSMLVSDAAAYLNEDVTIVRALAAAGVLSCAETSGGHLRFSKGDLDAYAARTTKATAGKPVA